MTTAGWTSFDTAIGRCGIAWQGVAVVATQLPEADPARANARLRRRLPSAGTAEPPVEVQSAIDGIVGLLAGRACDLRDVVLDMAGVPSFDAQVYAIARTIMPGATATYGEIAGRLGDRLLARGVGRALGQNPFPIVVPCHRVLAANGQPGGFSAHGGVATKLRMLAIEGVDLGLGPTLFDVAGIGP